MQRFFILSVLAALAIDAAARAADDLRVHAATAATPEDAAEVPTDSVGREVRLDEVTIVPTVKESTLMRQQPSAVSMISRPQLEAAHITSIKGVSAVVPNFFMPDYGSHLTSAIYIRGVGSRTGAPAVSMYVDNVPYADKSAFDSGFFDIERVDVLRGPQGTLYGRNAMGGIVRLYTKNPFTHEGLDVNLGYATGDNHRTLSLMRYHSFSPKFALSYGANYDGGDGFFRNALTSQKADATEQGGVRLRGIWKPNEHLDVDFSANYSYVDEGAYPYFYTGQLSDPTYEAASVGTICNNRESTYSRSLCGAGVNVERRAERWMMNSITSYQRLDDRMFMDQDFISPDIYTLEQRQHINTVTEELTFKDRTPDARWHWVSGASFMVQTLRTEGPVTFYGDGLRWLERNINGVMPSISQIPMLQRMGFTGMSVNFRGDNLLMGGTFDTPTIDAAVFHQSTFDATEHLSFTAGLRLDYDGMKMRYNAPADVDYGFRMPNAANARMGIDLQQLESHIGYDGRLADHHFCLLPKVALKYDFGAASNVYASASMGQRSGGYNLQMFSDLLQGKLRVDMMRGVKDGVGQYLEQLAQQTPSMPSSIPDPDHPGEKVTLADYVRRMMEQSMPLQEEPTVEQVVYRPEYSWNYEVGTHLNLLDRRLQVDAAAFLVMTRDQQISRFAPSGLGRMMVNAGRSRNAGAELTALWRPDQHWTLTGNYGFTHAKFTDYDAGDGHDYTGNFVPFVPRHTMRLDAAYAWLLSGRHGVEGVTLGADCSGAGSIYWTEANNVRQDFYPLLGARLVVDTKWATFQLWGKNLTSTRYNTFYFESAGRGFEQHGRPLQVGIDVRFSFR